MDIRGGTMIHEGITGEIIGAAIVVGLHPGPGLPRPHLAPLVGWARGGRWTEAEDAEFRGAF